MEAKPVPEAFYSRSNDLIRPFLQEHDIGALVILRIFCESSRASPLRQFSVLLAEHTVSFISNEHNW